MPEADAPGLAERVAKAIADSRRLLAESLALIDESKVLQAKRAERLNRRSHN